VLVFSRDPAQAKPPGFPLSDALFQQTNQLWDGLQENLKQLSRRSRRIIARNSGHYIQFDRPDLLNREVATFVRQLRSRAASPQNDRTETE